MTSRLPALMVAFPLVAALICPFVTRLSKRAGRVTVLTGIGGALIFSIFTAASVLECGTVKCYMGGWAPPLGIEFSVDGMNSSLAVFELFIIFMTGIYGMRYTGARGRLGTGAFYALYALMAAGCVGMTITGDMFNLYVFLEIMSLAGYGLIALSGRKGILSSFRYLLIGTLGASCYLIAIAFLYGATGTLNMEDAAGLISGMADEPSVVIAMILIAVALGTKMALFPFHGWQPDAYTYSNPGATPMLAGVMSKVPAYVLLRYMYFIFDPESRAGRLILLMLMVLGAVSAIYGSVLALAQTDYRRMLAYSSIAQTGYIVMGIGVGTEAALTGAVLHIIYHGFMKSSLYMTAGAAAYQFGSCTLENMKQIYKKIPITVAVIIVSALSMVGIPPTAGFFSKWYLMKGAAEGGCWAIVAVLAIGTVLNGMYFFRLFEYIFLGHRREPLMSTPDLTSDAEEWELHMHYRSEHSELHHSFVIPMIIVGIAGIFALGFFNMYLAADVIGPAFQGVIG